MIQFFPHKLIDKKAWDKCIQNSGNGLIYHLSGYLDFFYGSKWSAFIEVNKDGSYLAVLPLPIKSFFRVDQLFTGPFSKELGLVGSQKNKESFISGVSQRFKWVSNYRFNSENRLGENGEINHQKNYHLELNITTEELYKGLSKDRKTNLKRAEKQQLQLSKATFNDFKTVFEENTQGKIKGFQPYQLDQLATIVKMYANESEIVKAVDQFGEIKAVALFFDFKGRVTYFFSSSSPEGNKIGAMTFLLFEVIKRYAGKRNVFDFEGGNIEGIGYFFKSFGAKEVFIPVLNKNELSCFWKGIFRIRKRIFDFLS